MGRSRGGLTTKLHLRVEGGGRPLVILATAGQRHEAPTLPVLLDTGAVKRTGPRWPPRAGPAAQATRSAGGRQGLLLCSIRVELRRRGITRSSRAGSDQRRQPGDRAADRERNRVERAVGRLKQFRRVATRYEKLAVNYLAMVTLAMVVVWR